MGKKSKKKGSSVGKIRASHILVNKHNQAVEILSRIKEGENFADMAKQYSNCSSKKKGGDLGWFTRGQMVKEFETAVYGLNIGAITNDPIKTQFGYHIIKRTG